MQHMPTCPKCQQEKALDQFPTSLRTTTGRTLYECIQCKRDRNNRRNRALRVAVLTHYSTGRPTCACCKETTLEFLALDHIHGGGRKHRQTIQMRWWEWLRKQGYPKGFRVLCHNCNQAIGVYGSCPHQTATSPLAEAFHGYDPTTPSKSRKLTDAEVAEIRQLIQSGTPQCVIAPKFHVSRATICNIRKLKTWKHVSPLASTLRST